MYNKDREKIAEALYEDRYNRKKAPKLKGEIIGYKMIRSHVTQEDYIDGNYYLVKLKVLKSYKRYSVPSYDAKGKLEYIHTRAEKALVVDIIDKFGNHVSPDTPIFANSNWNWNILTLYQVGKIVKPDKFEKWNYARDVCDHGIHMIDRIPGLEDALICLPKLETMKLINQVTDKLESGEIKWHN